MKTWFGPFGLLLLGSVATLAGCVEAIRQPPELRRINLQRIDSPRVFIESAVVVRDGSRLILRGAVMRKVGVEDTTQTRLSVRLFDSAGRTLREIPARFDPSDIPRGPKMSGWSEYRVPLDAFPTETARIEIHAYEIPSAIRDH